MLTFTKLINQVITNSLNQSHQGTDFEKLMQTFFKTASLYKQQFGEVWLWNEFPYKANMQDTGIDLVAKTYAGEYIAIQCKCYQEDHTLQKSDIDSFLSISNKDIAEIGTGYTRRIVVTTTNKWSKNAEDVIQNQKPPVYRINLEDLEQSDIDWSQASPTKLDQLSLRDKKTLREHQRKALIGVKKGFETANKGKLIMACGTGKTFTSLKIMEELVNDAELALILVPSISLLSQTIKEWTEETEVDIVNYAVCSDVHTGRRQTNQDNIEVNITDLAYPATTKVDTLLKAYNKEKEKGTKGRQLIFSTYQSLNVIIDAQKKGLPEFKLIICDEAHRTTGIESKDKAASNFVMVHKEEVLKGEYRLYMTATPRLYDEKAKTTASEADIAVYSMDDEATYGKELYRLGFGEAVEKGLLTDYKVLVLAVERDLINKTMEGYVTTDDGDLNLDDTAKIIGCWNALAKRKSLLGTTDEFKFDSGYMKKVVAFTTNIATSKLLSNNFKEVVDYFTTARNQDESSQCENKLKCESQHIDGSMHMPERLKKMTWLKAETEENKCRILFNARCLSEGVDVPNLDGVMFLNAKHSMVDIVQSVGRVMRKAKGKKFGYIILPIAIPSAQSPEESLNNNKTYATVWSVLQALRSHDDRFNSIINKIDLNINKPNQIDVAVIGEEKEYSENTSTIEEMNKQLQYNISQQKAFTNAIFAKIVQKVGSRQYWDTWVGDIAAIVERHKENLEKLIEENKQAKEEFRTLINTLHKNIHEGVSQDEAIEMLSQHLVVKPVFNALFEEYNFTKHNPIANAMADIITRLEEYDIETNKEQRKEENEKLEKFHKSIEVRAKGIDNAEGKQRIIIELYDTFFKNAFPDLVDKLGIVYTPTQIVDFILHSVQHVLKNEFNETIESPEVSILDPFTGTGTFITRLIQNGFMSKQVLKDKYKSKIFANEIVLLAYYIATVNIENAYAEYMKEGDQKVMYKPFEGSVFTDTFNLNEDTGRTHASNLFLENNERIQRQKNQKIQIIVGNPPYSAGQKSGNDNNANIYYEILENKIAATYVKDCQSANKNSLYDSYIKAFRWATDRLETQGVIGFVTNAGWLHNEAFAGFRKHIEQDFSQVYIFDLRGNARKPGAEEKKKEGGNVFDVMVPTAITILVKKEKPTKEKAKILYYNIGDYLKKEDKLVKIKNTQHIGNLDFTEITADKYYDWFNQKDESLLIYPILGAKKRGATKIYFSIYSNGLKTNRDSWVINPDKQTLVTNMESMIQVYNEERRKYHQEYKKIAVKEFLLPVKEYVSREETRIKWNRSLYEYAAKNKEIIFNERYIRTAMYRPFYKVYLYNQKEVIDQSYQIPKLFPTADATNIVIAITGKGGGAFSCFASNVIAELLMIKNGQCFPLYRYTPTTDKNYLFNEQQIEQTVAGYTKEYAITDEILHIYEQTYRQTKQKQYISKENIFYYVYGMLHSVEYRTQFANNLQKELPRIPLIKDFIAMSQGGRSLVDLHLKYETLAKLDVIDIKYNKDPSICSYAVSSRGMKFGGIGSKDRSVIHFNDDITIHNIPLDAYEYQLNGTPAIKLVMDSYKIKTDSKTGIVSNPNLWKPFEPAYIFNVLIGVITLSLNTLTLQASLPKLAILSTLEL